MKDLDIEKLFDSMKKNDISEIIIKDGGKLYEFRRGGFKNSAPVTAVSAVAPAPVIMSGAVSAAAVAAATPVETSATVASSKNLYEIKSPLVGTFYSAAKPGAPALVEVGVKVVKGQKLCVVEAMKNFNEIESEVDGIVREILLKDGELVEFGKVLFRIEQI